MIINHTPEFAAAAITDAAHESMLLTAQALAMTGVDLALEDIASREGLTILSPATVPPEPLVYEDLVAAADVIVSKPGYGIVSECVANQVPLLYTTRGRFVEQDVFIREMPPFLRCRAITREALRAGAWADDVHALLSQPAATQALRADGAETIARMLVG